MGREGAAHDEALLRQPPTLHPGGPTATPQVCAVSLATPTSLWHLCQKITAHRGTKCPLCLLCVLHPLSGTVTVPRYRCACSSSRVSSPHWDPQTISVRYTQTSHLSKCVGLSTVRVRKVSPPSLSPFVAFRAEPGAGGHPVALPGGGCRVLRRRPALVPQPGAQQGPTRYGHGDVQAPLPGEGGLVPRSPNGRDLLTRRQYRCDSLKE